MINFKDFTNAVAEGIREYLPEDLQSADINIRTVTKANGIILTGVEVRMPGESVAPVVYLNDYYDEIAGNDNISMDDAIKTFANKVERSVRISAFDGLDVTEIMSEYANVARLVEPRVVNLKSNADMLKKCVYDKLVDLAVYYVVNVTSLLPFTGPTSTIKVTDEMLKKWCVSHSQVRNDALNNIHMSFRDITGAVMDMLPDGVTPDDLDDKDVFEKVKDLDMFVLTLADLIGGAGVIADDRVLKYVYRAVGNRTYVVLPSSVNEVIIVPEYDPHINRQLNEMVRTVNRENVVAEEQLSDHAYIYDGNALKAVND